LCYRQRNKQGHQLQKDHVKGKREEDRKGENKKSLGVGMEVFLLSSDHPSKRNIQTIFVKVGDKVLWRFKLCFLIRIQLSVFRRVDKIAKSDY
jgi:hypothetical protein